LEYIRFIHLKTVLDVEDQPSTLAPSRGINLLWQQHLLDTRSYKEIERLLLPEGGFIHHDPFKKCPGYQGRFENTRMHYQDFFHSAPPTDIWDIFVEMEEDAMNDVVIGEAMTIFVNTPTTGDVKFVLPQSATVSVLKVRIRHAFGHPPDLQRLRLEGDRLEDYRLLTDYDIKTGSVIDLTVECGGC
jgi:Ubiquitin family